MYALGALTSRRSGARSVRVANQDSAVISIPQPITGAGSNQLQATASTTSDTQRVRRAFTLSPTTTPDHSTTHANNPPLQPNPSSLKR